MKNFGSIIERIIYIKSCGGHYSSAAFYKVDNVHPYLIRYILNDLAGS